MIDRITRQQYKQAIVARARDLKDALKADYRMDLVDETSDKRISELKLLNGIARLYGDKLRDYLGE